MGKRVKKPKLKGGVTAMELLELPQSSSSSPLGVKTRARTLALQKIENPTPRRSPRLLNKPNPQINSSNPRRPNSRSRLGVSCSAVVEQKEDKEESVVRSFEETSCGENVFGTQLGNGSTRETTPCSLIRGSDTVGTPGSTTRVMRSSATSRRRQNTARSIPAHEIDELFTGTEQEQQRIFTEKYNFDLVNESPLPGRYEWERV